MTDGLFPFSNYAVIPHAGAFRYIPIGKIYASSEPLAWLPTAKPAAIPHVRAILRFGGRLIK